MPTKKHFQKRYLGLIVFAVLAIGLLTTLFINRESNYHIDRFIPQDYQDTLLVDIVTLMGVKPKHANWETRHLPQYRNFYIQQAENFNIYKYFIDEQETHFFYMIRPARHVLGNRRAVGGKLLLNKEFKITDYYELFVTQVLDEEKLKEIAPSLFNAMIYDELDKHLQNKQIIEWPDSRLKFDPVKKEWRYDVSQNQHDGYQQ